MKLQMRKRFTNIFIAALCLMILTMVSMTVEASGNADICIEFSDATKNGYTEDISVTFVNAETYETEMFTITYADCYGVGQPFLLQIPAGEYEIGMGFPNSDLYKVVDNTGEEVCWKPITIPSGEVLFQWTLKEEYAEEQVEAIDTENTEADALYNDLVEKVNGIINSREIHLIIESYQMDADLYERFTGNPKQEFNEMSLLEQLVLSETYLRVQRTLLEATYSHNFGTKDNFNNNYIYYTSLFSCMQGKYPEVEEAFKELLFWQYDYIIENGCCYNFMTGKSYVDIGGEAKMEKEALKAEAEKNAADMQAVYDDLVESGVDVEALAEEFVEETAGKDKEVSVVETIETKREAEGANVGENLEAENSGIVVLIVVVLVILAVAGGIIIGKKMSKK